MVKLGTWMDFRAKAQRGREHNLFGNKMHYILWYLKRYGENVPFINKAQTSSFVHKNYVRFVSSRLLNFYTSHISISCPFKQNQTKPIQTTTKKQLKNSISNSLYILIFLFYCGFCISNQHLQVMGFLNSITWYEKFSQETTKECSFFSLLFWQLFAALGSV